MTENLANQDNQTVSSKTGTALISIAPEVDEKVISLYNEGIKLKEYAEKRVITGDAELRDATDDLSIIAKVKKAIEGKRKEYVDPIRFYLDSVNQFFKDFTSPLTDADTINRSKIKDYRAEIDRQIKEAAAIEAEKMELARREAALNNGEITVDLNPVPAPLPAPRKVSTNLGSTSTFMVRKYRVVDFSKLPDQYKIENSALLNRVVKAGIPEIPGVEIYEEEAIRVNTR